jgi:hypothetical protein
MHVSHIRLAMIIIIILEKNYSSSWVCLNDVANQKEKKLKDVHLLQKKKTVFIFFFVVGKIQKKEKKIGGF